jgi:hypothetical protein
MMRDAIMSKEVDRFGNEAENYNGVDILMKTGIVIEVAF